MPSCQNNIEAYTNSNNLYQYGGSTNRRSTNRRSIRGDLPIEDLSEEIYQ